MTFVSAAYDDEHVKYAHEEEAKEAVQSDEVEHVDEGVCSEEILLIWFQNRQIWVGESDANYCMDSYEPVECFGKLLNSCDGFSWGFLVLGESYFNEFSGENREISSDENSKAQVAEVVMIVSLNS